MADKAPDYNPDQGVFHEAFRSELYSILDALPIPRGGHVLDVPCGNGFYTRRLAERLGPNERLTAVDASNESLRLTRELVGKTAVDVRKADAYRLPFADAAFDLIWCAQSLISLDPDRAVREMFRVAKCDGVVAILEVDELHRVLLPWPVELEAALPTALKAATTDRFGDGEKTSPARKLRRVLQEAGFQSVRRMTYPFDRAAPFDALTTKFLADHFHYLRSFAYPHLAVSLQKMFDRLTDPEAEDSLYLRSDTELVCLNAVYLCRPSLPRE